MACPLLALPGYSLPCTLCALLPLPFLTYFSLVIFAFMQPWKRLLCLTNYSSLPSFLVFTVFWPVHPTLWVSTYIVRIWSAKLLVLGLFLRSWGLLKSLFIFFPLRCGILAFYLRDFAFNPACFLPFRCGVQPDLPPFPQFRLGGSGGLLALMDCIL